MDTVQGQSVLVTGGGGFIGSHLVERLVLEGARVCAFCRYNSRGDSGAIDWLEEPVRAEVDVVFGDLRDAESVAGALSGRDCVFHLGAQIAVPYSFDNPRDFFETNVLGALNVALAARDAGTARFLHMSTSEVYGTARHLPMHESHPLEPRSPYAASKLAAEKLMASFQRSYGLPVVVVRPFNTYGPRQSARALVPTIITQALTADRLALGALHPTRDLLYVGDTVSGLIAAAGAPSAVGRTIALGTGREVSVGRVAAIVMELLGRDLDIELDEARLRPNDSEVDRLVCDPAVAREELGWSADVGLEEGLALTIDWIRRNLGAYPTYGYIK
jgi:dTDP-glucose 4,6-dehydratase